MYSKQICLPEIGLEGQRLLHQSKIAVVGIGGLGCAALPYLAAAGIGRIGLIDGDLIELSNLPRQILFRAQDVGFSKAKIAAQRLSTEAQFDIYDIYLDSNNAETLLQPYDLILDATDNSQARLTLNDACRSLKKPWVYGALSRWEGQVSLFNAPPELGPDYRSLFCDQPTTSCDCSIGGVMGAFVGLIGSIQALEAMKWILGLEETLAGKLLCIDSKTWRSTLITLRDTTLLPNWNLSQIQLEELRKRESVKLIDAREPFSIDLLRKDETIVFYCQRGIRSNILAKKLRQSGFKAYSLERELNHGQTSNH